MAKQSKHKLNRLRKQATRVAEIPKDPSQQGGFRKETIWKAPDGKLTLDLPEGELPAPGETVGEWVAKVGIFGAQDPEQLSRKITGQLRYERPDLVHALSTTSPNTPSEEYPELYQKFKQWLNESARLGVRVRNDEGDEKRFNIPATAENLQLLASMEQERPGSIVEAGPMYAEGDVEHRTPNGDFAETLSEAVKVASMHPEVAKYAKARSRAMDRATLASARPHEQLHDFIEDSEKEFIKEPQPWAGSKAESALDWVAENMQRDRRDDLIQAAIPKESRMEFGPGSGKSPAATTARDPKEPIASMQDLVKEFGPLNIPQTMEKVMSAMEPDLMQKFYPRIYEETGRYHSPKVCAAFFANVTSETAKIGYHRTPNAYRLMLPALQPMIDRRMPLFFIAPDLLKAIQMTDFVDDIDWTTLRLPYEQGVFMLPKGALVHETDGDVAMVMWCRFKAMVDYPAPIAGWPPTTIGHDAFILIGLCPQTGIWYDSVFNANVRPMVRLHNLFYRAPGERTPPGSKYTRLDEDLTEKDEAFLEKLGVIAFGTFLAMNAKPELVEKGKLLKRVVKAGQAPREFWSPNVIGPRYRLKREVVKIDRWGKFSADQSKRSLGGTHASPRLHWRRGHFRNQAVGAGRKLREQRWIEPMLVGAETEEQAKEARA